MWVDWVEIECQEMGDGQKKQNKVCALIDDHRMRGQRSNAIEKEEKGWAHVREKRGKDLNEFENWPEHTDSGQLTQDDIILSSLEPCK